jgi:hypothetical protein
VRLRTLLDKLRPLDQKLRYQIDKLLKIATLGQNTACGILSLSFIRFDQTPFDCLYPLLPLHHKHVDVCFIHLQRIPSWNIKRMCKTLLLPPQTVRMVSVREDKVCACCGHYQLALKRERMCVCVYIYIYMHTINSFLTLSLSLSSLSLSVFMCVWRRRWRQSKVCRT